MILIKRNIFSCIFILLFCSLQIGCKNSTEKNKNIESAWNTGNITISTDENLKEIMQQLVQIYEHLNADAHITLNYQPQDKIIKDFVDGKISSMLISRNLTPNEIEVSSIKQKCATIEQVFGYDAIAAIVNKNYNDSVLDIMQLQKYLLPNSTTKLIFDNEKSGIVKVILQKGKQDIALSKNAFVVKNTDEVIEYIKRSTSAIGFVPFHLLSDTHIAQMQAITHSIKILQLRQKDTLSSLSQATIYNFTYPLMQPINIVLGNNPETVAKGFITFLCKEKAAKILLKAGLVPQYLPNRAIKIVDELKTSN